VRIVVKIGGSLIKEEVPKALVDDLKAHSLTHQFVIVHGGGEVVTDIATRMGKEQRFVVSPEGIRSRYTDKETAEIYRMVMTGLLAKRLVLAFRNEGLKTLSLSGIDAELMQGKRKTRLVVVDERGRKIAMDGGYTGKVQKVNAEILEPLLSSGYIPIISPVALSEKGEPLNVDGDRAASIIAQGIKADLVFFMTNVDGLLLDESLVRHMSLSEASSSLPKIGFGMQKKIMAAVEAVEGGVKEAVICSGLRVAPISSALSHNDCTVIS
jgi:[amino group carrier protein]-L-2-aminoadipate 6-kinase